MSERFGITLFLEKHGEKYIDLVIRGIRVLQKVPYDKIQIFKNDKIKAEYSISLLEKLDFQMLLFTDMEIILFKETDKIGIKLI